ncbi:MAG: hypothetical protein AAB074_16085 [Planctomycetota bacterium]
MNISKIVTTATLALCFSLGIADSLFTTRALFADAQSDLSSARSLVEETQDAIARVENLSTKELEANPELLREAHRLAEDARTALTRARTSLANQLGKSIGREEAIQINLAIASSEAKLRNASRNLPPLPTPEPKEGKMSPERAVKVLNRDVQILTTLLERSNALYDDDHARATVQAAFDRIGTRFPNANEWGDSLWLRTHDPLGRLSKSIDILRRYAKSIARNGSSMNADYVVHLHDAALRIGREHKSFMETAAGIVDNLARQAKSMQDDHDDGEVGNPNPGLDRIKREMKPLYEAINDRNLMKRPREADEWVKLEAGKNKQK